MHFIIVNGIIAIDQLALNKESNMAKSKKRHRTSSATLGTPVSRVMASRAASRAATPVDQLESLRERQPGINKALEGSTLSALPQFNPARRIAEAYLEACRSHSSSSRAMQAAVETLATDPDRPVRYGKQEWDEGMALAREAYHQAVATT